MGVVSTLTHCRTFNKHTTLTISIFSVDCCSHHTHLAARDGDHRRQSSSFWSCLCAMDELTKRYHTPITLITTRQSRIVRHKKSLPPSQRGKAPHKFKQEPSEASVSQTVEDTNVNINERNIGGQEISLEKKRSACHSTYETDNQQSTILVSQSRSSCWTKQDGSQ